MNRQVWSLVACGALLVASTIVDPPDYIDTVVKFLSAWGKGNWKELATVAADRVTVSVGGRNSVIDVSARKTDVMLVFPFKGLSTVRTGGRVTSVAVHDISVNVRGRQEKGKGTLMLEERGGRLAVVRLTVQ